MSGKEESTQIKMNSFACDGETLSSSETDSDTVTTDIENPPSLSSEIIDDVPDQFETTKTNEIEKAHKKKRPKKKEPKLKIWKVLIISLLACLPLAASVYTQRSPEFANLTIPLKLTVSINPINKIGLFEVLMCAVKVPKTEDNTIHYVTNYQRNVFDKVTKNVDALVEDPLTFEFEGEGCGLMKLEGADTDDLYWLLSRSFSSSAIYMGIMSILSLWVSYFNGGSYLAGVAAGFFSTYLLQVSVFLIYDSKLCTTYGCHLEKGTIFCAVAGLLWLACGFCVLKIGKTSKRQKRKTNSSKKESIKTVSSDETTALETIVTNV